MVGGGGGGGGGGIMVLTCPDALPGKNIFVESFVPTFMKKI